MDMPTVKRVRVTWTRWDGDRMRNVISHPWQHIVTESDGYERAFDTRPEADGWIAENYPPAGLETVTEVTRPDGSRFVSRVSDLAAVAVLYRPADGYKLRTITGHTVRPEDEEI